MIGRTLGHDQIAKVGAGGIGEVHRARETELGRDAHGGGRRQLRPPPGEALQFWSVLQRLRAGHPARGLRARSAMTQASMARTSAP